MSTTSIILTPQPTLITHLVSTTLVTIYTPSHNNHGISLAHALPNISNIRPPSSSYSKYSMTPCQMPTRNGNPAHPSINLPTCPLCCIDDDSRSHLLCSCTHPQLFPLRQQLTKSLRQLKEATHPNSPIYFSSRNIVTLLLNNINSASPYHRTLLGLFHLPTLSLH